MTLIWSDSMIPADSYGVWESSQALWSSIPPDSDTNYENTSFPDSNPVSASQNKVLLEPEYTWCHQRFKTFFWFVLFTTSEYTLHRVYMVMYTCITLYVYSFIFKFIHTWIVHPSLTCLWAEYIFLSLQFWWLSGSSSVHMVWLRLVGSFKL